MPLEDDLAADLRDAMRAGDVTRRETIRQLRAGLHNEGIAKGRPLGDDESMAILQRLINQHRDSISEFTRFNRDELVAKEQAELEILLGYQPAQMSRDEIVVAIREAIAKVGASGRQDQGKLMREVAPHMRGKADMRVVNEVAQELLG